ncbi:hypothetical protein A3B57_03690 [Microgenomates group bacterium RIFCSPLOWO2_01_FULL_47_10]|nr:MAG: hypothetical protein A3B57_03690 [Microgenomates group bacterium RIFCSPLOWO2_01_FULL_47_10]
MKRILVHTIPNSRSNEIKALSDTIYKIKITAPPVEGLANQALIRLLAKYFKVHKSQIMVIKGLTSDKKIVEIDTL